MSTLSPLEAAKMIVTLPLLARLRGWKWKPTRYCEIPYRPGAQGMICHKGRLLYDPGTDEVLDAVQLLARVERLDDFTACHLLVELAGNPLIEGATPAPMTLALDDSEEPFPKWITPRAWPSVQMPPEV